MGKYILTKLQELRDENLVSFHVPGHKIGSIYEKLGYKQSENFLRTITLLYVLVNSLLTFLSFYWKLHWPLYFK